MFYQPKYVNKVSWPKQKQMDQLTSNLTPDSHGETLLRLEKSVVDSCERGMRYFTIPNPRLYNTYGLMAKVTSHMYRHEVLYGLKSIIHLSNN